MSPKITPQKEKEGQNEEKVGGRRRRKERNVHIVRFYNSKFEDRSF